MKQGHLATAAFWIGLLTLFGWQASAQIPRAADANPERRQHHHARQHRHEATHAADHPLTRSAPTPIPPADGTRSNPDPASEAPASNARDNAVPSTWRCRQPNSIIRIRGKLTVLKEDNYVFIRHVCCGHRKRRRVLIQDLRQRSAVRRSRA